MMYFIGMADNIKEDYSETTLIGLIALHSEECENLTCFCR
jgi:hypothetical protein